MTDDKTAPQPTGPTQPPPIPNPHQLQPTGLSNTHKRRIFYCIAGVITLIVLANVFSPTQTVATKTVDRNTKSQQQNPSPAQIQEWERNLKQTEAQLQDETKRQQQQLNAGQGLQPPAPMTNDDLQRAAALQDAAQARAQYAAQQAPQQSQLQTEKEQRAYKSLFADSVVQQQRLENPGSQQQSSPAASPMTPQEAQAPQPGVPEAQTRPITEKERKPLDFIPAAQQDYWLPEGTVIEAALTNRLDGDAPGPVNCMITTDVYLPGTRLLLLPQGTRVLGDASKVSSFGQERLAVAFHRFIVPGLRAYSIPLDKDIPGLAQAGEVGLHDKVNNHYFSIFGASLAVGAIGGLTQIGNAGSALSYDPSAQFRNGVSQSMAQSSDRILDRFLNRMPTITIREGTRVKILLTDDLQLPSFDSMHKGAM